MRVSDLQIRLNQAEDRLAWAKEGRALFEPDHKMASGSIATAPTPASVAPSNGTTPTLREAVLRVFLAAPARGGREPKWPAIRVIEELERRGSMPNSEKYGRTAVRTMLRDLVKRGQLVRTGRGAYMLAPDARAQGEHLLVEATKGFAGSTQRNVIEALSELARPATPSEIVKLLQSHGLTVNKGSVHNALPRLMSGGKVIRHDGGRYELASRNGSSAEPNSGPTENGVRADLFGQAATPGGV